MKTLGFDLDGVIYDWHSVTYDYVKIWCGVNGTYESFWKTFDEKNGDIFKSNLLSTLHLYSRLVPRKKDLETLHDLAKKYEIIYITARGEELEYVTKSYLRRYNYPNYTKVTLTKNKPMEIISQEVGFYVEDNVNHIRELKNLTTVIGMKRRYNNSIWDLVPMVNNLQELPLLLEKLDA